MNPYVFIYLFFFINTSMKNSRPNASSVMCFCVRTACLYLGSSLLKILFGDVESKRFIRLEPLKCALWRCDSPLPWQCWIACWAAAWWRPARVRWGCETPAASDTPWLELLSLVCNRAQSNWVFNKWNFIRDTKQLGLYGWYCFVFNYNYLI